MKESGADRPPAETQLIYELVGILVHTGTAESGHYYSYIRDSRPRNTVPDPMTEWYEFNDSEVKPFRIEDMDQYCFGGADATYELDYYPEPAPFKTYSAYMLFYRKRPKVIGMSPVPLERQLLPAEIVSKVQKTNDEFIRRYVYYGDDFSAFVAKMLRSMPRNEKASMKDCEFGELDDHDGDMYPLQLGLEVYRLIISRMEFKSPQEKFCTALKSAVRSSPTARHYFYFWLKTTPDCIRELLLSNMNAKARLQSAQLIAMSLTADEVVKPRFHDRENAFHNFEIGTVCSTINDIGSLVYTAGDNWRTWNEYFEALALIARDPDWARYMIQEDMLCNCLYHFMHSQLLRPRFMPKGFARLKYPDSDRLRPSFKELIHFVARLLPHLIVAPEDWETDDRNLVSLEEPGYISADEHLLLFTDYNLQSSNPGARPISLNILVGRLFETRCEATDISIIVIWLLKECILRPNLNHEKQAIIGILSRQCDPSSITAGDALEVIWKMFEERDTFESADDKNRWRSLVHIIVKRVAQWSEYIHESYYGHEFLMFWKCLYETKDEMFQNTVLQRLAELVPELMFSNELSVRERTASWIQQLVSDLVDEGHRENMGTVQSLNRLFVSLVQSAFNCLDRKLEITERTATFESLINPVLDLLRILTSFFITEEDQRNAELSIERKMSFLTELMSRHFKSIEVRSKSSSVLLCRWK